MRRIALATLLALTLSACGHSERFKVEDGICYKHARYWFIFTMETDTNRVTPDQCQP